MSRQQLWEPYPEELKETPLGGLEVDVFMPDRRQVVMGASGKAEREVFWQELQQRGIPLYKRKGGGGTVVLGPQDCLVVTVHAGVAHTFRNGAYFAGINQALIDCFNDWREHPYRPRGLSDIAVGEHKLVGSSIFRRKQYLLFQASILLDPDMDVMRTILQHPPRQPDYRADRSHDDFLTSLRRLGVDAPVEQLIADLQDRLPARLRRQIDLVDAARD